MLWEKCRFPTVVVKILLTSQKDKRMIAKKVPYWNGGSNSCIVWFFDFERDVLQAINFCNVRKHWFFGRRP